MRLTNNAPAKTNALLWTVQGLLAALFLFAGGMKLALPSAALAAQSTLPVAFIRFIGVCEMLGALGLILPELLRMRIELTPLAASGLVIIMIGAVSVTAMSAAASTAAIVTPAVVGCLAAVVAYGRARRIAYN